jgi:hypothetical protein
MAGRLSEAGRAIQRLQQIAPALCISNLKDHFVFSRSEDMQRLAAGLEKAELPRE